MRRITIQRMLGIEAEKIYMDMQPGMFWTYADVSDEKEINFKPSTSIEDGLKNS